MKDLFLKKNARFLLNLSCEIGENLVLIKILKKRKQFKIIAMVNNLTNWLTFNKTWKGKLAWNYSDVFIIYSDL